MQKLVFFFFFLNLVNASIRSIPDHSSITKLLQTDWTLFIYISYLSIFITDRIEIYSIHDRAIKGICAKNRKFLHLHNVDCFGFVFVFFSLKLSKHQDEICSEWNSKGKGNKTNLSNQINIKAIDKRSNRTGDDSNN